MKTDLCTDDMVVRIATPQIITAEGGVVDLRTLGGSGGAAAAAADSGRRLLAAARDGDTNAVRQLMAKGAAFTADWLGTSPLHLAALHAHPDTVGVLLRAGVSRDARTKVDRTALHVAAEAGHEHVCAVLLEAGATVDARDMLRMTPLHWAAERGHRAVCALLLRAGADPLLESKFLKTPLALARRDPDLLQVFEDCAKEREAARSVHALVDDRVHRLGYYTDRVDVDVNEALVRSLSDRVDVDVDVNVDDPPAAAINLDDEDDASAHLLQKSQELNTKGEQPELDKSPTKAETKSDTSGSAASSTSASASASVAARLLRAHGIALLPADDGSTVLNALQSGRTVVLSDAGKLMLKESSAAPAMTTAVTSAAPAAAAGGGVVLTATPVLAPPPGVKVFTLSNATKLAGARGKPAAEAKAAMAPAPAPAGTGDAKARPAVKIVMSRANLRKLVAIAHKASPQEADDVGAGDGEDSVVVVPEQFVRSASAQFLRSQLLCAHAALQHQHRELRQLRKRLQRYEPT